MNKYLRSDIEEATRTRRWLLKQDMRREKRWIVDPDRKIRIPCAWYAISVLAKRNGITCVSKHATRSHESEVGCHGYCTDWTWETRRTARRGFQLGRSKDSPLLCLQERHKAATPARPQ